MKTGNWLLAAALLVLGTGGAGAATATRAPSASWPMASGSKR